MKIINEFKKAIKDFKHYYSGKEISKRLDAYTEKRKNFSKRNMDIEMDVEELFGGEDAEQVNALMRAFKDCAKEENKDFYKWLDKTPKTIMIVLVVEKLNSLGYKITKQ